jgi:hypothetical protein
MKLFYMVLMSTLQKLIENNNRSGKRTFSLLYDLPDNATPDTKVLVCLILKDDADDGAFEKISGVEILGDPLSRTAENIKVKPEHATALAHMGVKQGDSLVDLVVAAGKMHPMMKVRGI